MFFTHAALFVVSLRILQLLGNFTLNQMAFKPSGNM